MYRYKYNTALELRKINYRKAELIEQAFVGAIFKLFKFSGLYETSVLMLVVLK
jgi:hypothetical protein